MITRGEILEYLSRNKKYFRDNFHIIKIGLFGSYAKGEQRSNSDIDLIVEFERDTPNLYDLKNKLRSYIREDLNIDVDICREKYIKSIFKDSILRETLYVE
jgi:predicted nucleotidyltransferase